MNLIEQANLRSNKSKKSMSGVNPVSLSWVMSQFATVPTTCQPASVDQVGLEIVFIIWKRLQRYILWEQNLLFYNLCP